MNNYPTISQSLENTGKSIRNNIPHIIIGKKNTDPRPPNRPTNQNPPIDDEKPNRNEIFTPKEQDWIIRLRKWGLIIGVSLIALYATYRIILAFSS